MNIELWQFQPGHDVRINYKITFLKNEKLINNLKK